MRRKEDIRLRKSMQLVETRRYILFRLAQSQPDDLEFTRSYVTQIEDEFEQRCIDSRDLIEFSDDLMRHSVNDLQKREKGLKDLYGRVKYTRTSIKEDVLNKLQLIHNEFRFRGLRCQPLRSQMV